METWGLGSTQDSQKSALVQGQDQLGRLWELREGTLFQVGVLQR